MFSQKKLAHWSGKRGWLSARYAATDHPMRVTTDFWVSAVVRRVFSGGGFAAVIKRGATEAGVVFVVMRDRMGGAALFGPAPQTSYDSARPDDRFFIRHDLTDEQALDARLEKEKRFDPDIWVIEIEPGHSVIGEFISIAET